MSQWERAACPGARDRGGECGTSAVSSNRGRATGEVRASACGRTEETSWLRVVSISARPLLASFLLDRASFLGSRPDREGPKTLWRLYACSRILSTHCNIEPRKESELASHFLPLKQPGPGGTSHLSYRKRWALLTGPNSR